MANSCYTLHDLPVLQRTIHLETKGSPVSTSTKSRRIVSTMVKEHHRQKDFSRPLHVDCSVEYELPNQAKPPHGIQSEPLLMIHPCYFRKIESQRHSLFVNNMPVVATTSHRHFGINATNMTRLSSTVAKGRTLGGGANCTQYQLGLPQMSQQAATPFHRGQEQYDQQQLWEPLLPQLPIPASQNCLGLSRLSNSDTFCPNIKLNERWSTTPTATAADLASRSPDRPEVGIHKYPQQETALGIRKYRQYQRPRRLHPYDISSNSIPIPSIFQHHHASQIHQQVCYNV